MTYRRLVEAAIEAEKGVMGEAATGMVEEIEGIELDGDEVVELNGDGKELLDELVKKYKSSTGPVAKRLISNKLEDEDLEGLELPESLED